MNSKLREMKSHVLTSQLRVKHEKSYKTYISGMSTDIISQKKS